MPVHIFLQQKQSDQAQPSCKKDILLKKKAEMLRNFSLTGHNTFGLDVMAAWVQKINDINELEALLNDHVFKNEKHMVLGGGSNCLFLDDYYEGLVILMQNKGITITDETEDQIWVSVAAGEDWPSFVDQMVAMGYGGLENLSLIPGKVGAAPMQNIGAYGVEIKDVFDKLLALEIKTGKLIDFERDACDFGYRSSIFKTTEKGKYIILSVDFVLQKHPELKLSYGSVQTELSAAGIHNPTIADVAQVIKNIRLNKLPRPEILGNAGSFFKNPVVHEMVYQNLKNEWPEIVGYPESHETIKIAAAWLIEKAGWKGKRIGDAAVHDKQSLVLVNHGNATGRDIYSLAMEIQRDVKNKFGVVLEPEVNII